MPSRSALLCALPLCILAGCGEQPLNAPTAREQPVARALDELRIAFNKGECASIFDNAHLAPRLLQPKQDWLIDCQRMRDGLGSWLSFDVSFHESLDAPLTVTVAGHAVFENGVHRVSTAWQFENGSPRLFRLLIDTGSKKVILPQLQFPTHRLLDKR